MLLNREERIYFRNNLLGVLFYTAKYVGKCLHITFPSFLDYRNFQKHRTSNPAVSFSWCRSFCGVSSEEHRPAPDTVHGFWLWVCISVFVSVSPVTS